MILPAISIRQPWAWAILYAGKDIENRSWRPRSTCILGKPVLLHAGTKVDHDAIQRLQNAGFAVPDDLPVGGIVGLVEFCSWSPSSCSLWAERGLIHWEISRAKPLQFFPCPGQLRFFSAYYPHDLGNEWEVDHA